ncbi:hypothetical protein OQA88_9285 [Cercophora sp. LCS_1]
MAPVNGVAPKAGKTSARHSKPVIPVLPLNYPQRPFAKQASAPHKSSPLAEIDPNRKVVEHVGKPVTTEVSCHTNGVSGELLKDNNVATAPAIASVDTNASRLEITDVPLVSELPALIVPLEDPSADASTVVAAASGRSIASPAPTRPVIPAMPQPNSPSLYASSHDMTITAQPTNLYRHGFHHAHPSNGSLVFGLQDSNTSSPAPHSGGFPPPGVMGYPSGPPDGRGFVASPPLDGLPRAPYNHHGPPTPHSFHGSQNSVPDFDHSVATNPYSATSTNPYPISNGAQYPLATGLNGYPDGPVGPLPLPVHPMNAPVNSSMHPGPGPASLLQSFRDSEETLAYLRSATDDQTFSDCVVEIQFPDARPFEDHPDYLRLQRTTRIPGHRFLLARSPVLAQLMRAQQAAPGGVLVIQLQGEYHRSDVFCYALRSLYGWNLGEGILPSDLRVRNVQDDFKLSLSYLAAGQYLRFPPVHSLAIQRASSLVCWETLELGADFVLPSSVLRTRTDVFSSTALLGHILGFIINNFPQDFVLDKDVDDSGFCRLPTSPTGSPTRTDQDVPNGHHSRQSSVTQPNMQRNQRLSTNPRLSLIKFGDMAPNGFVQQQRAPTARETVLSRILLNLPYELLKQVLEDQNLGGVSVELGRERRQAFISDIIAEREQRRLRTLDKYRTDLRIYQEALEKAAAPLVVEQVGDFLVNNMGFKEEVCLGDVPFLVHTWVSPASGST